MAGNGAHGQEDEQRTGEPRPEREDQGKEPARQPSDTTAASGREQPPSGGGNPGGRDPEDDEDEEGHRRADAAQEDDPPSGPSQFRSYRASRPPPPHERPAGAQGSTASRPSATASTAADDDDYDDEDDEDDDDDDFEDEPPERESRSSERARDPESWNRARLADLIKRGLERGIEAGVQTWERGIETGLNTWEKSLETGQKNIGQVRERIADGRLPRELASAIFHQVEETKNGVLRVVAREVRDFLEATDIAGEIKAALTSLSFEIKTEVRFIPNDAGTGVRPDIKSATSVKVDKEEEQPPAGRSRKRRWRNPE